MIAKALLLLALGFLALGALRFAGAPPRPRWLAPAAAGIAVTALLWRFGALGVAAGAATAALLWFLPQLRTAPHRDMGLEEARALLGLGATATAEDIRAAHRRRIADAHPDRGGAPDAAARLNAARDRLLKALEN
jgi:DnaJ homolog subfamily C member 19